MDSWHPEAAGALGWVYSGGASGAQALLSAVAGSMITVVSVTFSVTVVALTVSSQHFGPRLLNSFMRDAAAQLVLGTFIGTFAYCVVVLRTVHGEGDGYAVFVPHLAVTAGVALTLVSVGMLIYYVHHVSASLQVSEIAHSVAADLERAVARIYPEPIGTSAVIEEPPAAPHGALRICSEVSGYLQEIDGEALVRQARAHGVVIWVRARPGDFVVQGSTLALVDPRPLDGEGLSQGVRGAVLIGRDRTSRQDAGFAVQQLVEVALHALSPGMNEPFTAITCVDRLTQGLVRILDRDIPSPMRLDSDGAVRVVAFPRTFPDLLRDAFSPIRVYAGANPAVAERVLQGAALLAERARRAADRDSLRLTIEDIFETSRDRMEAESDRQRLGAAYRAARAALEHGSAHG
jgi:uncharacterized membrane protein